MKIEKYTLALSGMISLVMGCLNAGAAVNDWTAVKTALYEQIADNSQSTSPISWNFYISARSGSGDAANIALTGPGIGSPLQMTQITGAGNRLED